MYVCRSFESRYIIGTQTDSVRRFRLAFSKLLKRILIHFKFAQRYADRYEDFSPPVRVHFLKWLNEDITLEELANCAFISPMRTLLCFSPSNRGLGKLKACSCVWPYCQSNCNYTVLLHCLSLLSRKDFSSISFLFGLFYLDWEKSARS